LAAAQRPQYGDADRALFAEFRAALSRGTVRAAERLADGTWRVNAWVKRGILLGFRMGALVDMSPPHSPLRFFDKDTYPTRATTQIGKRVHLSAAAQVGGVLEPVGALPVVVEDDVLVGGGCGIYEGAVVRARAVLAPGTILTAATPVHDLVRERVYRRDGERPLEIPAGAVVVPGSRTANGAAAGRRGTSLYPPVP